MKFLYKLEAKIGKYSIKNLPLYISVVLTLSYFLALLFPEIYVKLIFSPYQVLVEHEYWRLFTWIFTTPGSFDVLTLVSLVCYFFIGSAIENAIGTFMFNVYVFGGWLLTTLGITVTSAICYYGPFDSVTISTILGGELASFYLTWLFTMSIYLCFALIFAENTMLFMMVLPIKAKILGYIDLVVLAYYFISLKSIICRVTIIAGVLNCFIFYVITKSYSSRKSQVKAYIKRKTAPIKRKRAATVSDRKLPEGVTRHKCAVCGKTEKDGELLEFRFCSKCKGNYEYCSEHLFSHEHVK